MIVEKYVMNILKNIILSITNIADSSIARESDEIFHTWADLEIAVASTKA